MTAAARPKPRPAAAAASTAGDAELLRVLSRRLFPGSAAAGALGATVALLLLPPRTLACSLLEQLSDLRGEAAATARGGKGMLLFLSRFSEIATATAAAGQHVPAPASVRRFVVGARPQVAVVALHCGAAGLLRRVELAAATPLADEAAERG